MLYNKNNKRMYVYLLVMTVITAMGFQSWRSMFNNFAVETVGINGQQMGVIQGVREIPGFLALLVVYVLFIISEHRLAAVSLLIMGAGIALTGLIPSYQGLLITTIIMSFGFHYYETVNQSLTLQYFDKKTAPLVLSKFRSFGAAANIAAGGFVFLLSMALTYKQIFIVIGAVVGIGALWCLTQNPASKHIEPQHKKMIFKKKYWLFYVLTLLAGARRQIFMAFAVFLLVQKFQFSVKEIVILFVVNNLIGYFLFPYVGKMINKIGERKTLSIEYISLFFVFLAYAFVESKMVIATMYILDHFFFSFAIGIKSYFQKTADVKDIAPSMAVGFTINHIAAVTLPVIGGLLWMVDYKIPFIAGACLSLVSLAMVQFIRTEDHLVKEPC